MLAGLHDNVDLTIRTTPTIKIPSPELKYNNPHNYKIPPELEILRQSRPELFAVEVATTTASSNISLFILIINDVAPAPNNRRA